MCKPNEQQKDQAPRGPHEPSTMAGLAGRGGSRPSEVGIGPIQHLNPGNVVLHKLHLPRSRRYRRVHDGLLHGRVPQTQHVAYLVHRHRFQVHRRRQRRLRHVAGGHPVLRRVQVEPPVRRRKRVCQRPQHPVERFTISMVPRVKPYFYVRARKRRRFAERYRRHLRPLPERPCEHALNDVVEVVVGVERIGQLRRALRPPRLAWEERVVRDRVEFQLRGVGAGGVGAVLAGVHGGGAVDDISYAAAGAYDLAEGGIVELAGDVEVEVLLVGADSGLQRVVEVVREVRRRSVGDVPELVEVVLEF